MNPSLVKLCVYLSVPMARENSGLVCRRAASGVVVISSGAPPSRMESRLSEDSERAQPTCPVRQPARLTATRAHRNLSFKYHIILVMI